MIVKRIHAFRKKILFYTAGIILSNLVLTALYSIVSTTSNNNPGTGQVAEKLTIYVVFMVGFFAPFFEETLMRGLIQGSLQKWTKIPVFIIYLIVAAIFAALHLESFFLPYFITSLFLSHSYSTSNYDLVVPLCCHINYNLFVLLLLFLQNLGIL